MTAFFEPDGPEVLEPERETDVELREPRSLSAKLVALIRWAVMDERMRYLAVGGFNVTLWTLYFVLFQLWIGHVVGYMGVLVIAYVLSNLSGFFLHRSLVFQVKGKFWLDLGRFTLVQLTSFFINAGLLPLFVEVFGLPVIPAQVMIVVLMVVLNFVAHKFFSFRRKKHPATAA